MENVREWAAAVCCACVIAAMLAGVFPAGGQKLLRTVLSLLVLCVLFRPLAEFRNWLPALWNMSFDVSENANPVLEREVKRNAEGIYASYLRENLCRVLDGNGISYESVEIWMDNSDDGCISIERVEVIVKKEEADTSYQIKKILSEYLGFEPLVMARTGKGSE